MQTIPGLKMTICTKGEDAAVKDAEDTQGLVMFWKNKKRMLAIYHPEQVIALPFETRREVDSLYETLRAFNHPSVH